ncbi:hypothetical protein D3C74_253130 [compost metagenome]
MGQGKLRGKNTGAVLLGAVAAQQPRRGREDSCGRRTQGQPQAKEPGPLARTLAPADHSGTDEQQQRHHHGACEHHAAVFESLQQPRHAQCHRHRTCTVCSEQQRHIHLRTAQIPLHQHHCVDDDHGGDRGDHQIQRHQAAQFRCRPECPGSPGEAMEEERLLGRRDRREARRGNKQSRRGKAEHDPGEEVVVAGDGQQRGRQHRAGQRLHVIGQPRQRQGPGVIPLIGQDRGNDRLERGGEGRRC